ncbi:MAG: hypothetical protein AAGJ35_06065, partial [Myxococcota bacterium]
QKVLPSPWRWLQSPDHSHDAYQCVSSPTSSTFLMCRAQPSACFPIHELSAQVVVQFSEQVCPSMSFADQVDLLHDVISEIEQQCAFPAKLSGLLLSFASETLHMAYAGRYEVAHLQSRESIQQTHVRTLSRDSSTELSAYPVMLAEPDDLFTDHYLMGTEDGSLGSLHCSSWDIQPGDLIVAAPYPTFLSLRAQDLWEGLSTQGSLPARFHSAFVFAHEDLQCYVDYQQQLESSLFSMS